MTMLFGYALAVVTRLLGAFLVLVGIAYFVEIPGAVGWEAAGSFVGGLVCVPIGILLLALDIRAGREPG